MTTSKPCQALAVDYIPGVTLVCVLPAGHDGEHLGDIVPQEVPC